MKHLLLIVIVLAALAVNVHTCALQSRQIRFYTETQELIEEFKEQDRLREELK